MLLNRQFPKTKLFKTVLALFAIQGLFSAPLFAHPIADHCIDSASESAKNFDFYTLGKIAGSDSFKTGTFDLVESVTVLNSEITRKAFQTLALQSTCANDDAARAIYLETFRTAAEEQFYSGVEDGDSAARAQYHASLKLGR